ncbi:phage lysin [Liquorilactobacillus mali KCTC 3596 = DSM 20444]|uniref:GH25 family lysozyme n=1 Tax=Liquorilactobacillus mali TaxID=1618 RepID=UPI00026BD122|nr:GH25 family lysozyme [Liquorilactobacillus mali]EJE97474.1 phage lysin [Liquorilactobacillus mali KCTC 3596 = DSM 20444]
MKLKNKILLGAISLIAPFFIALNANASTSTKGDYGVDNSYYQGTLGNLGSASTKFNIIQIGGIYNTSVKYQSTYATQVQYTIAQGRRAHSYIYLADGSNQDRTKQYVGDMLSKMQTPKNSIVAVDYESGATSDKEANTANIELAMSMIKAAGYTPMFYSYKPYANLYVNTNELASTYGDQYVWIASYKTTSRQLTADFNYFPSFPNVGMWQFADNYGTNSSGVDGDIDITGVTGNGYNGTTTASNTGATTVKTDSTTTAIKAGQVANNTPKSDIKVGYVVKVNYSATKWSNGATIPSWVKGNSYTVQQISGSKILLSGILSWIDKSNAEILSTGKVVVSTTSGTTTTVGTSKSSGLTVDGVWITNNPYVSTETTLGLQKIYDMKYQDGKISKPSALIKVIQKHLGVTQDGKLGPITINAMEKKAGLKHTDGVLTRGGFTVKYIQTCINKGIKPF